MPEHGVSSTPIKKLVFRQIQGSPEKSAGKVTIVNLNIEGERLNLNLRLELDSTKESNISLDSSTLENSVNKVALEKPICVEKSINTEIASTARKQLTFETTSTQSTIENTFNQSSVKITSEHSTVETSPRLSVTESSPIQQILGKLYVNNLKAKLAQAMHKTKEKQDDNSGNSAEICQSGNENDSSKNVSNGYLKTTMEENRNINSKILKLFDENSSESVNNGHLSTTMKENSNINSKINRLLDENSSENVNNGHLMTTMKESSNINSKIDKLLDENSSSESENEPNSFVETMAEEGEEDTPSEGSNDIIEIGEEINTTESEFSDGSYENDSFIDDEEKQELLSGNEYDLSLDNNKKRTRIIKLSSGSDDDIVRIERPKKIIKKRKKSRIIRFRDSSDEENIHVEQESNKKIVILENIRIQDINDKDLSDNINNAINVFCPKMKSVMAGNSIAKTNPGIEETSKKCSINNVNDTLNVSCPTLKNDDFITSTPIRENNVEVQIIENKDISDNTCLETNNKIKSTTSRSIEKNYVQAQNMGNEDTSGITCAKTKNELNCSNANQYVTDKQSSDTIDNQLTNNVDNLRPSSPLVKIKRQQNKKKCKNKMKQKIKGGIVSEEKICRKNKKRKRSRKTLFDVPAPKKSKIVNILNKVVVNKKEIGCLFESTLLNKDWSVNSIIVTKPSQENTNLKSKKNNSLKPDKVKTKDFKSQMLYDRTRNLRIDTQKLLRKKLEA